MSGLLIMGSGVVGNFAAAYFRRYFPRLRVTVVGRSDQELPIVGESLVELSTHFLQDLGLSRTLIEQHLPKYGLTYYYKLDPSRPRDPGYIVDEAPSNPPFPSFLINRFSFDAELRRLNRQRGVRCIEGKVTEVSLGSGAPHRVKVQRADGREESLEARWLVDATGRRRLLARQLGLQSRAPHQRSAFWFRLVDFDPSILDRIHALKKVNWAYDSYYCTHHFFGKGNWVWLIPVRSEDSRRMISIGLTYRPDLFPGEITSTREFMDWMAGRAPPGRRFRQERRNRRYQRLPQLHVSGQAALFLPGLVPHRRCRRYGGPSLQHRAGPWLPCPFSRWEPWFGGTWKESCPKPTPRTWTAPTPGSTAHPA